MSYLLTRPERMIRDYFVHTSIEFGPDDEPASAHISIDFARGGAGLPDWIDVTVLSAGGEPVTHARAVPAAHARRPHSRACPGAAHARRAATVESRAPVLLPARHRDAPRDDHAAAHHQRPARSGARRRAARVELNRKPIVIHGMNRHDSDPRTGYAISAEQFMEDLLLMKQHNVNGVRTSHYPNAPHFYDAFEQLGFLVIDEADLEAHGANDAYHPIWRRATGGLETSRAAVE